MSTCIRLLPIFALFSLTPLYALACGYCRLKKHNHLSIDRAQLFIRKLLDLLIKSLR